MELQRAMMIGRVTVSPPFGLAPMAGLTDTAFRRLVKRQGGCGLVVTEMVSAEGLVRGQRRTREYIEYADEERPIAIQLFGSDPERMAAAASIVEGVGADIVDVNMGCPVPKIARGHAGCRLMGEPARAAAIVAAMARAVAIPVTVKMRTGWDDRAIVAPEFAKRMEDAGAAAVTVHGRSGAQSYGASADWDVIARVAGAVAIPVLGNGDCVEPEQVVTRWRETGVDGVVVGRGAVRNPWLLAQAAEVAAGRPARAVTRAERARFLLDYLDLLLGGEAAEPTGCHKLTPRGASEAGQAVEDPEAQRPRMTPRGGSQERWAINKLRALVAWYTKGLDGGSRLREIINRAESIHQVRDTLEPFFLRWPEAAPAGRSTHDANLRV